MNSLQEFRIYYNHTIHPELVRQERKRVRLLWLLFISIFVLTGIIIFEFYVNIFFITLFMMIPLSLYIAFLFYQIRKFVIGFKPRIINLILDFIALDKFEYFPKRTFPKKDFMASRIFSSDAPSYQGEDFIQGRIGEVEFEMGELNVREFSQVRSRLNYVFRGVMLKAKFEERLKGKIYILPEEFKQYLTRSIKLFTRDGAVPIELENELFEQLFMVYATSGSPVYQLLSSDVQEMLVNARREIGKEIYISFIDSNIYIAVTEDRDLLEPYIFQSNVSFELVREFYEDLLLLFSIIEDFDVHH